MVFIWLVFGAALALELLGSYVSILGLSKNASYILVALAITLDFSKIIIATVLYKQWVNLHNFLKFFLVPSLLFLVIYTSAGAYAFLLQEFSKTTTNQEQTQTKIVAYEQERVKLEARKKEIDGQISQLPPESVVQRKRLTDIFSAEINQVNSRLIELDKQVPELKIQSLTDTSQGGTVGSLAKAYNISPESITKVLVFFMVLVIDPLAIVLLTVANFLLVQKKKDDIKALNERLEIEALLASDAKSKEKNETMLSVAPTERIHAKESIEKNIIFETVKKEPENKTSLENTVRENLVQSVAKELTTPIVNILPLEPEQTKETIVQKNIELSSVEDSFQEADSIFTEEKFVDDIVDNFSTEEIAIPTDADIFNELDSLAQEQEIKEALFGKDESEIIPPKKSIKVLSFPPKKTATNDVFDDYEISDSDVSNLIGSNPSKK